ncbi:hypothetical protein B0H11DRAFT_571641 [Mycena galericulata]|nr:hypothetical protein B0H11DRAFT_571641 [Mycena galericulata]
MLMTRERDKSVEDEKDRTKRRDSKKRSERETQKDSDRDREKEGRRRERRESERSGKSSRDAERERAKDLERRESRKTRGTDKDKPKDKKAKEAAAYGPDFLRAFAKANSVSSGKDSHFDVITGEDAEKFTRRFVREHADADAAILPSGAFATAKSADSHASQGKMRSLALDTATASDKLKQSNSARRILPPVVFALPRSAVGDAGRKVVDFYMSWRGKTKTHPLKGGERRTGFLDAEFKRVRETLDGEWKRASRALRNGFSGTGDDDGGGPTALARAPTDPQAPPRLSPLLAAYAREEQEREERRKVEGKNARPSSTPPTTRAASDPLPPPSSFPINLERPPLAQHRGSVDSLTSVTSLPLLGMVRGVPVGNRVPLRVTNPGDRMSMSSSSGSVVEVPKPKLPRSSPLREGVAFDVPDSDDAEGASLNAARVHRVSLPGRTASDSSGTSSTGSSRKSKHSRKQERREEEREKILIVLLDEKEKEKDKLDDSATWHGLERRLSTRSSRKPSPPGSVHDSPWRGLLADLDEDITYIGTPDHSDYYSDSDEDSDEQDANWGRRSGAVMPIKTLLSTMGYLTPEAAVLGGTPSPYGSYAPLPTPYNSPYSPAASAHLAAYSSPYVAPLQSSPYHSPYPAQMQLQPPSRPHTPVTHFPGGTPQQALAWSSPGGAGYPHTAYASPAPAGYASPYASASPAVGYASPYPARQPGGGIRQPVCAREPGDGIRKPRRRLPEPWGAIFESSRVYEPNYILLLVGYPTNTATCQLSIC